MNEAARLETVSLTNRRKGAEQASFAHLYNMRAILVVTVEVTSSGLKLSMCTRTTESSRVRGSVSVRKSGLCGRTVFGK
jgi:hypothetical protein